jgi:phospholipid transport system transporter-binding protein
MANVTGLFQEGLKLEAAENTQPTGRLEIDFSGIEKVDSSAVSLMLVWLREAQRNMVSVSFVNVPDNLLSLAKLYGVAELLTLAAA